jgi:hypothetical protein
MELYCTPKSQYTTVKQSETLRTHVHVRPARYRNSHSYRILPTGPLVAIFQHSLPFLRSESFQTHVGAIHRQAISPLAHHNCTSAYNPSLTCTSPDDRMSSSSTVLTRVLLSRNFPIRTQSSSQKESVAKYTRPISRPDFTRANSSTHWAYISRSLKTQSHIHRNACPLLPAQQICLFTLLSANQAKAIQHCCVSKETPQRCTMPLL